MSVLIDSYSESNYSGFLSYTSTDIDIGQSFTGFATSITSAKFYLRRLSADNGTVTAQLFSHTGTYGSSSAPDTLLATSDTVNVSSLPTDYGLVEFTFSGSEQYEMSDSTYYVIKIKGSSDASRVYFGYDGTSPTHSGNYWDLFYGSVSSYDAIFYVYGKVNPIYSKEDASSLGSDDSTLTTEFSTQDYTDVGADNDTYVDLVGSEQYFQFLFKEYNSNDNSTDGFRVTWKGKSTLAPSSYTVYLQIYNRTTTSWTTLTSNNTANAHTKFTLTHDITADMSDYYDANHVISARVYQDIT